MSEIRPDSRRSVYNEGCLAAHALDLLGERWSFLVIRELIFGPKRFGLLRAGLPGVSASVLTQRLQGLELAGIVRRRMLPDPAEVQVYELTEAGQAALPLLEAMCQWAVQLPGHDPTKFISPSALMISMGAMIDGAKAAGMTVRAGFDLGRETFTGGIEAGRWQARRGAAEGDIAFVGSANALAPVIYGPAPLRHWIDSGAIAFTGDPALGQRFVDLFSLRPR